MTRLRDDRLVRRAGFQEFGRQAIEARVTFVADDQALIAVEHAQAVRHVLQRRGETQIGFFQRQLPADAGGDGNQLEQREHRGGGEIDRPMALEAGESSGRVRHHEDEADPENGNDRQAEERRGLQQGAEIMGQATAAVFAGYFSALMPRAGFEFG